MVRQAPNNVTNLSSSPIGTGDRFRRNAQPTHRNRANVRGRPRAAGRPCGPAAQTATPLHAVRPAASRPPDACRTPVMFHWRNQPGRGRIAAARPPSANRAQVKPEEFRRPGRERSGHRAPQGKQVLIIPPTFNHDGAARAAGGFVVAALRVAAVRPPPTGEAVTCNRTGTGKTQVRPTAAASRPRNRAMCFSSLADSAQPPRTRPAAGPNPLRRRGRCAGTPARRPTLHWRIVPPRPARRRWTPRRAARAPRRCRRTDGACTPRNGRGSGAIRSARAASGADANGKFPTPPSVSLPTFQSSLRAASSASPSRLLIRTAGGVRPSRLRTAGGVRPLEASP